MSQHTVTEAEARLSDLIDRSLAGEGIVITRGGLPVVELLPVATRRRVVTPDDLDWLAERRSGLPLASQGAGDFLGQVRDDDER